jgi:hypothetical protein
VTPQCGSRPGRSSDVAELITRRLATLADSGLQALDEATVRAVVRQAVRDVRTAPTPPPADPSADPTVAALRRVADDLAASSHAIGELMLEVAPAPQVRAMTCRGQVTAMNEAAKQCLLLTQSLSSPIPHSVNRAQKV